MENQSSSNKRKKKRKKKVERRENKMPFEPTQTLEVVI